MGQACNDRAGSRRSLGKILIGRIEARHPLDSVGMVKAMNEIGFKPKMWGGAMVGLQATVFKTQLGPLLNGIVNYETWIPAPTMQFPGSMELLKKYQARAAAEGVDPLGYYMPV
jgi:branched-chain amino acid transport system substrate-binding protein